MPLIDAKPAIYETFSAHATPDEQHCREEQEISDQTCSGQTGSGEKHSRHARDDTLGFGHIHVKVLSQVIDCGRLGERLVG